MDAPTPVGLASGCFKGGAASKGVHEAQKRLSNTAAGAGSDIRFGGLRAAQRQPRRGGHGRACAKCAECMPSMPNACSWLATCMRALARAEERAGSGRARTRKHK